MRDSFTHSDFMKTLEFIQKVLDQKRRQESTSAAVERARKAIQRKKQFVTKAKTTANVAARF